MTAMEIIGIETELEEAGNLTAFLNQAAVEMIIAGGFSKEGIGLQYCFFHLENKLESARERLYQLRLKVDQ